MAFQKATKYTAKLRLALCGTAGAGKTWSALAIASELVPGGRIALIDTERGSAKLYADHFAFDTMDLERHSPQDFVDAIREAEREAYDVIIIDSLSHAWVGRGGALEMADQSQKRGANSFTAWRDVTPHHQRLVEAIISSKAHVIATMRSKTEYAIEKDDKTGKTVVKRMGMEAIQRSGIEYEFTLVGDIDLTHTMVVTKSRCSALADAVIEKPGAQVARTLREWLGTGAAPPVPVVAARPMNWDQQSNDFFALIEQAKTMSELLEVASNPVRPVKGTEHYDAAIAAYQKRKAELEASS